MSPTSPLAIGIDLGTTYSVLATINAHGQPEVIPNSDGGRITPSVICFSTNPPLVGEEARARQAAGDDAVASFFKRNMGDPSFALHLAGRDWTPVDLSALVLARLKADGEAALGQPIRQCVITVPAYFHHAQREATIQAGRQAGLEVLRIINEPTAAALAYGLHQTGQVGTVLVYDLGGGTFDVSLVRIGDRDIEVLATAGDHNLGGKDWDDRLAVFLGDQFAQRHGVNPLDGADRFNELLVQAERAKRELSARETTRVVVDHEGQRETLAVTRARFEEMTRDLLERTGQLTSDMLREQKLTWDRLTGVLLVGGSTRMPMVHEFVLRLTGKRPMTGVNVDEAVALGAAVQAALDLEARSAGAASKRRLALPGVRTIKDVTAHTLGVIAESPDRRRFVNSHIVPRNSPIPAVGEREYDLFTRNGQLECIVYVTEGDSVEPRMVAVRGKYICRGPASSSGLRARVVVRYAYDRNGTIQVAAREAGSQKSLEVVQEAVDALEWLGRSPTDLEDFDPKSLELVVSPPKFDDIGIILDSLGLTPKPFTGGVLSGDILFLNCGSPILPDARALRRFVEGGGCVYASDLTDSLVQSAFPGVFEFAGHTGGKGQVWAEVVDPELRTALGESLEVQFDLGGWAELGGVGPDVRVLLRNARTQRPLMAAARQGDGQIFFTCFHNHAQASATERSLLQLLVAKQISTVAGVPIEVVARATGLAVRKS
jgi:molecular chaperone DnaK (HSP70)